MHVSECTHLYIGDLGARRGCWVSRRWSLGQLRVSQCDHWDLSTGPLHPVAQHHVFIYFTKLLKRLTPYQPPTLLRLVETHNLLISEPWLGLSPVLLISWLSDELPQTPLSNFWNSSDHEFLIES